VCVSLCTTVVHSAAQNSSDNFPLLSSRQSSYLRQCLLEVGTTCTPKKRISRQPMHKTDPPVVAFLVRNAKRFIWVGDDTTLFTREVHCYPTLHVQQASALNTSANCHEHHDTFHAPPPYATSHPGQLSPLPYAVREMSTGQSAVMLCGWGVKAGMAHIVCG